MSLTWNSDHTVSTWLTTDVPFEETLDDEDECKFQTRLSPCWNYYRSLIEQYGFKLDTARDVRAWYRKACQGTGVDPHTIPGYLRACAAREGNELYKDAGLPDQLFRGTRIADGATVVVKAVHVRSNEFKLLQLLSSAQMMVNPDNRTIQVYATLTARDDTGFIVMEEAFAGWPVAPDAHCKALHQCLKHLYFLHSFGIAHLDISSQNILFNLRGDCVWIDHEASRYTCKHSLTRIRYLRAAEIPPELERQGWCDPFEADMWAVGKLFAKMCKCILGCPDSVQRFAFSLLEEDPAKRPSAFKALCTFEQLLRDLNMLLYP